MQSNPSVLLVNSDPSLLTVLSFNLSRYGFIVNTAENGFNGLKTATNIQPSIVIIDDNINGVSGNYDAVTVCLELKKRNSTKNIPIIVVTTESEKYKSIASLKDNISDFLSKPFVPSELVARIKGQLKKTSPIDLNKVLEYKGLKMYVDSYKVLKNGKRVHLGPTEFKILQCLMELPSKTLSRDYIMRHVWGYDSQVEPRTIDVHINRLRSALKNENGTDDQMIKTIRAAGYCLSF